MQAERNAGDKRSVRRTDIIRSSVRASVRQSTCGTMHLPLFSRIILLVIQFLILTMALPSIKPLDVPSVRVLFLFSAQFSLFSLSPSVCARLDSLPSRDLLTPLSTRENYILTSGSHFLLCFQPTNMFPEPATFFLDQSRKGTNLQPQRQQC